MTIQTQYFGTDFTFLPFCKSSSLSLHLLRVTCDLLPKSRFTEKTTISLTFTEALKRAQGQQGHCEQGNQHLGVSGVSSESVLHAVWYLPLYDPAEEWCL